VVIIRGVAVLRIRAGITETVPVTTGMAFIQQQEEDDINIIADVSINLCK